MENNDIIAIILGCVLYTISCIKCYKCCCSENENETETNKEKLIENEIV